jgi:membrane-bound lytic murein transglycosylase D
VPKVIAAAIVAKNPAAFGIADLAVDPPLDTEEVSVPPGTALATVAQACGCATHDLELLNPELRASRTPPAPAAVSPNGSTSQPLPADYPVRVPSGRGAQTMTALAKLKKDALERYVVRFGESIEQIALTHKIATAKLIELNAIAPGEMVRGGTVLLVPRNADSPASAGPSTSAVASMVASAKDAKPVVAVPADIFVYPDRRRVFYRVVTGDTLRDISNAFKVSIDDLRRWNDLDPSARLQDGMTLQLFVPADADLSRTVVLSESDVHVLPAGSEEFVAYWEGLKGKKRITVTAKAGDTIESIGRRHGVSPAIMEKINRRNRSEALRDGDVVILYVTGPASTPGPSSATASSTPTAP